MIRAALVGISGYGRWHLAMLADQTLLGRVKLVAATVINQPAEPVLCSALRAAGVVLYSNFDDMIAALAGRIDLVLIPTGIHHHAGMAVAALRAGAHVLVEKPLCATLQEADAIQSAVRASGRTVAVGFQDLYPPLVHETKRRLLAGEIGRVRRVVVRAQWPRPAAYFTRNTWAGKLRCEDSWVLDSPVNNACAHFMMLSLFWGGATPGAAATPLRLEGSLLRANPIESFDTASFRLTTAEGLLVEFHGTHAGTRETRPEVRVIGEAGEVVWVYEQGCTLFRSGLPPLVLPVPEQLATRLLVLDHLVTRINGGDAFIATPSLARTHTLVVNALHAYLPIHPVPASACSVHRELAGNFTRVIGLDSALEIAAREGILLAEQGLPWAPSSPDVADLANLSRFDGPLPIAVLQSA